MVKAGALSPSRGPAAFGSLLAVLAAGFLLAVFGLMRSAPFAGFGQRRVEGGEMPIIDPPHRLGARPDLLPQRRKVNGAAGAREGAADAFRQRRLVETAADREPDQPLHPAKET